MTEGARRAPRNDLGLRAVSNDADVMAAMDQRRQVPKDEAQTVVEQAIACTDERTLKSWIAVAIWEDESGRVSQTVICDDHSSNLEIKGYLHDAVWASAHSES